MPQTEKLFSLPAKLPTGCDPPSKKSDSATPFCKVCFKEFSAPSWRRLWGDEISLCGECFRLMDPQIREWAVEGIPVRSLYLYNEEIRSLLFQYKGCYDIELSDIFLAYQAPMLRLLYHGYTLVPAPSYQEKDDARGFNHVVEMFRCLHLPILHALEKRDNVKQADCSFSERQRIGQHLRYVDGVDITGKKILFVDDLFTTGATAKACCALLRAHHPSALKVLVMGFTPEKGLAELDKTPVNG